MLENFSSLDIPLLGHIRMPEPTVLQLLYTVLLIYLACTSGFNEAKEGQTTAYSKFAKLTDYKKESKKF